MGLSNTAVPKYYGKFREAVLNGEIPVCEKISLEMNRIDELIRNPRYYYDEDAAEVLDGNLDMTPIDKDFFKLPYQEEIEEWLATH